MDGSRYSILEYESAYNSKRLEEHTARACNVYCPRLNICHGRKYLQSERLNSAHRFHGMEFERNNISIGWKKKKKEIRKYSFLFSSFAMLYPMKRSLENVEINLPRLDIQEN